jgi:hypothetical protein
MVALEAGRAVFALTVEDRERILRVLDDCPGGLTELCSVLLREHEWRYKKGSSEKGSAWLVEPID